MRVLALLAAYKRRFIDPCLEHLHRHGIDTYLIDNGSTDDTVARAERRPGRGLIGIESLDRGPGDFFDLRKQLRRKEELARELDADWFIHLDADEIRLSPVGEKTLAQALEVVRSRSTSSGITTKKRSKPAGMAGARSSPRGTFTCQPQRSFGWPASTPTLIRANHGKATAWTSRGGPGRGGEQRYSRVRTLKASSSRASTDVPSGTGCCASASAPAGRSPPPAGSRAGK
jgi:Glycosyl transferase family 2